MLVHSKSMNKNSRVYQMYQMTDLVKNEKHQNLHLHIL